MDPLLLVFVACVNSHDHTYDCSPCPEFMIFHTVLLLYRLLCVAVVFIIPSAISDFYQIHVVDKFSHFTVISGQNHAAKQQYVCYCICLMRFLSLSILEGETDNSSTPIRTNSSVRSGSAPSSPQIPTHFPHLWALSTTIFIILKMAL